MTEITELQEPLPDEEKQSNTGRNVLIGILVALLVAALFYIFWGRSGAQDELDDSWERILSAGVLRVGIAADYPPFSYYNNQHMIDGFDPALIHEIGNKLGIRVEMTDFAFEGLGPALEIGQIDVVIAALSVTPSREALADFSNIYYVGEDGVLAREGSDIDAVNTIDDMAFKRLGVQRRSVYEDWVRENLIAVGKLAEDQLFVYAKPEHAVSDLELGRLDLVMMDLQPALTAAKEGNVSLVGKGFNQQRFAIAVPVGAATLQSNINNAITALQNEGVINQLAMTYLGLRPEDILPIPTPEPTPDKCVDGMAFVDDLTYDDNDLADLPELDPGEAFSKGWRIRNTGTCDWTSDYYADFVRGDRLKGEAKDIDGDVKPGQTYDLYIDFVAPQDPGEYVGFWQIRNADDVPFGETIWVAIEVPSDGPAEPTKTPEATATLPPDPTEPPEIWPTPPLEDELVDVIWYLEKYRPPDEAVNLPSARDEDDLIEVIPDTELLLIFETNLTLMGSGGCNTLAAEYTRFESEIDIFDIISGRQVCDEPTRIMEQEHLYILLLDEEVVEYQIIEESGEVKLELWFEEIDEDTNERKLVIGMIFEQQD
ncbi:MAG: transporter substrate-binding domain-containing protein [Chloroflexota bacterium]|nr:transporter substrate-binding domain-containing protein [Chloroflexota bacterium]